MLPKNASWTLNTWSRSKILMLNYSVTKIRSLSYFHSFKKQHCSKTMVTSQAASLSNLSEAF